MKRIFTAAVTVAVIALAGAIPATATTFPALTLIYVASGVLDNSVTDDFGITTVVNCSNLSGQTASVRYQFRSSTGTPLAGGTLLLPNLATHTIITEGDVGFQSGISLPTGPFYAGVLQVLSTQSAIYCSASLVHAGGATSGPAGVALHMVRFNPHPGTVE